MQHKTPWHNKKHNKTQNSSILNKKQSHVFSNLLGLDNFLLNFVLYLGWACSSGFCIFCVLDLFDFLDCDLRPPWHVCRLCQLNHWILPVEPCLHLDPIPPFPWHMCNSFFFFTNFPCLQGKGVSARLYITEEMPTLCCGLMEQGF